LHQRELTVLGGIRIREDVATLHALPDANDGTLVETGALVGANELVQAVHPRLGTVLLDDDLGGGDRTHGALGLADHDLTGVDGGAELDAGTDQRRLRLHQRHSLALHIRAHQRAVGVVVFDERDERGRHGQDLLRRDVDVVDVVDGFVAVVVATVDRHPLVEEAALVVDADVGLGDVGELFLIGREVCDLVGDEDLDLDLLHAGARQLPRDLTVDLGAGGKATDVLTEHAPQQARVAHGELPEDAPTWRLEEAVWVDAAVARERADEADVRPFRRLDRTDPAVVRIVHVADVESGALARQATWPERREAPLVGQLVQRVGLLHELRQLA